MLDWSRGDGCYLDVLLSSVIRSQSGNDGRDGQRKDGGELHFDCFGRDVLAARLLYR